DDRHARAGAAHARPCSSVSVRARPERNQHRADGREEDGEAAPPVGPEAFIAECRKEIEAIGNGLLELAVRVGMSADFAHVYYTDSDEYRAFSQAIFLELWPKGLFYRGERPTFWCPVCETPLAEADIE